MDVKESKCVCVCGGAVWRAWRDKTEGENVVIIISKKMKKIWGLLRRKERNWGVGRPV